MNISNIKVKLTEKDLIGMIDENLKIDGFKIDEINIKNFLQIRGHYNKGLKINFLASLYLKGIENNILKLGLANIKLGKIPIWSKLVNFALRKVLKKFQFMGISLKDEVVCLDFYKLLKYIPAVEFILKDIVLFKEYMEVEVENLVYIEGKKALSLEEIKNEIKNDIKSDIDNNKSIFNEKKTCEDEIYNINKTKDEYSKVRDKAKDKLPEGCEKYKDYILLIPDIVALLYRIMIDERVKTKTKVVIGAAITYLALPVDIIPDFIPVIGKIDDIGIVFLALDKIIDDIPENIILEHWQGKDDIIIKAKEIKKASFNIIGRQKTISILSGVFVFSKKIIHRRKNKNKTK
ncbi:YkvA family protein [Clostridium brassicae]|uniref:YkvA family protein n=1 Tax=Clostridium brassicae TaxID=2999072 RepID=A0ABT4DAJ8_9CLOT|nr:YkvA family protein [Clostridium brassicae]MCY6959336.1 YkvA family protein [Clostridium brassicae]